MFLCTSFFSTNVPTPPPDANAWFSAVWHQQTKSNVLSLPNKGVGKKSKWKGHQTSYMDSRKNAYNGVYKCLCIYSSLGTDGPCGWHFQLINLRYNRRLHQQNNNRKPTHRCGTVHTKTQLTFQRAAWLTTTVNSRKINFMWLVTESQCSVLNQFQMLRMFQLNKWAGTSHWILLECVRLYYFRIILTSEMKFIELKISNLKIPLLFCCNLLLLKPMPLLTADKSSTTLIILVSTLLPQRSAFAAYTMGWRALNKLWGKVIHLPKATLQSIFFW